MNQPHNLLGAPAYRPAPEWPRAPALAYAPPPPAPPDARLTVRPKPRRPDCAQDFDQVTLTKPLLLAVPHLRHGGPVDLVPPTRRGGTFYLDTRATALRRLPATPGAVARFAVPALSREHYLALGYEAREAGALGTVGVRPQLTFRLGEAVEGHPGYFELIPIR